MDETVDATANALNTFKYLLELKRLQSPMRRNPRSEFEKRVRRSVGILKRKDKVEGYKAKNVRVRLITTPEQEI